MSIDRSHFQIRLLDDLVIVEFGHQPNGPTERVISVGQYSPRLVPYLDALHQLPIPDTADDPRVAPYLALRSEWRSARVRRVDAETLRYVDDQDALVLAIDRILEADPTLLPAALVEANSRYVQ